MTLGPALRLHLNLHFITYFTLTYFRYVEEWVNDYDVQLVGGCCGLTPEYINAVATFIRHHNRDVRTEGEGSPALPLLQDNGCKRDSTL